jgi:hypothetical protein
MFLWILKQSLFRLNYSAILNEGNELSRAPGGTGGVERLFLNQSAFRKQGRLTWCL